MNIVTIPITMLRNVIENEIMMGTCWIQEESQEEYNNNKRMQAELL